jgi:hypothetical protein
MFNFFSHQGNADQSALMFHLLPVRMAIIKQTETTNVGEDVRAKRTLCTAGGNVN